MALELWNHARDPEVRMAQVVSVALGPIGPASGKTISALKAARKDPAADVQLAAACALYRLDPSQATDVLPGIRDALGDRDWTVRSTACSALAIIGPGAKEVVPALLPLLRDPVKYVRREAAQTVRQVDPETATKHGVP
jgi:HEAT repeat protein